jgi:HEAT repeat protein
MPILGTRTASLLGALLFALPGLPAADQSSARRAVPDEMASATRPEPAHLQEILKLLVPLERSHAVSVVAAEILALGPDSVPAICHLLWGESDLLLSIVDEEGESKGDHRPDPRACERRRSALLAALRALPFPDVLESLARDVWRDGDIASHVQVLHVVREAGDRRAIPVLLRLLGTVDGQVVGVPAISHGLRQTLQVLVRRDRHALATLVRAWEDVPGPLQREVIRTFRQIGSASALDALVDLAGTDTELEVAVLDEMSRFPPMALASLEDLTRQRLRSRLNAYDHEVRAAAVRLVASIQDMRAFGEVVALLEDEAPRVRGAAAKALQDLSGKRLGGRVEDWGHWHAGEREWFEQDGTRLLGVIAKGEPSEVLGAMRSVAGHRLYRREFSLVLLDLLDEESAGLRRCAIGSLRLLGAREAVVELIASLEDPEPEVRHEAWTALVAITGENLPCESEAWEEALWRWQG